MHEHLGALDVDLPELEDWDDAVPEEQAGRLRSQYERSREGSDAVPEKQAGRLRSQYEQASSKPVPEEQAGRLRSQWEARRRYQRASEQKPRQPQLPVPKPSPWKSRGYLPHFDDAELVQTINIRLVDSLPSDFLKRCDIELARLPPQERSAEKYRRIEAMLDRGKGECHLREPRVAELVENALLFFDTERYRMLCWCIMPNHVHTMIETFADYSLASVLHSWKSFTSKEANKILQRQGLFWQTEYYDRFIRDDDHYKNATRYIEDNPVKAGLARSAEDWRWSSAWRGRKFNE